MSKRDKQLPQFYHASFNKKHYNDKINILIFVLVRNI
jgi:hypothetical protein